MLELIDIKKTYRTGKFEQRALDGVSLCLRENEFVAILGHSGSGKTTLLNIIGGLDHYDSGDLIINGRSTKRYSDRDWDTYRNHTIGFVFQSYNLIPHQSVLSNVEMALTLKGTGRSERRRRAKEALIKVGLADHIHKKPNQLSGGQMQRVAIARALVNDPDILLADEPTGALDSETSVQIMNLLKEIAKDKLVVMVTHNPELAEEYANRIIRIADGKLMADSNPCYDHDVPQKAKRTRRPGMSFFTALSLSFNNLKTKKGRTFLTSGAGSIGIIGIALITAISSGVNAYIEDIQRDTLSSYPITIEEQSMDLTSLMSSMESSADEASTVDHDKDAVYSSNIMSELVNDILVQVNSNNLEEFKNYIEENKDKISENVNGISYTYNIPIQIYSADTNDEILQVNPSTILSDGFNTSGSLSSSYMSSSLMSTDVWTEMIDNPELYDDQYDIIAGSWPTEYNEVVLFVSKDNEVTDYTFYALGMMDQEDLESIFSAILTGEEFEKPEQQKFTYEDILNTEFKVVLNSDYYKYNETTQVWEDQRDNELYMKNLVDNGVTLKITGIARPKNDTITQNSGGKIGYLSSLTEYVINGVNDSAVVKAQKEASDTDIFTNLPFEAQETEPLTMEQIQLITMSLSEEEQAQLAAATQGMSEEEIIKFMTNMMPKEETNNTYEGNLEELGVVSLDKPSSIYIYPTDFESKETISNFISEYNDLQIAEGKEENTIEYTDITALLMQSVTTIVDVISYVLIAFVAISLVVSSIMIGVITNISVLERTKEIGILRAMGASKKDISRVFNAETFIIGLLSGLLGVGTTYLLIIPINKVLHYLTDTGASAQLSYEIAIALVIISMLLTLIAGIIPSRSAAKKDPVIALRTE